MRPGTVAHALTTLAPVWGTSPSTLERTTRELKNGGVFPTGKAGVGPFDSLSADHLAALTLGFAGREPIDSLDAYRALAGLRASDASRPYFAGFAGLITPAAGVTLAESVAAIMRRCSALEPEDFGDAENALEGLGWHLHLCVAPAAAFITWGKKAIPHRIEFLQTQSELLDHAPRQIARWTAIPFRAIAAAARILAENAKRAAVSSTSPSDPSVAGTTDQKSETPPAPWQAQAANSSEISALTAEPGRSVGGTDRIYPIRRGLRKRLCDSDSASLARVKGSSNGNARRISA